jgi:very-short-patch-repair endonuclease
MRDATLSARAKAMRHTASHPEPAVWRVLRAATFDVLHFRRQVAFGTRYIADFASHRARVIVEVDGRSHDASVEADAARTRWFEAQGYRVVRVTNDDAVDREVDLGRILQVLLGL